MKNFIFLCLLLLGVSAQASYISVTSSGGGGGGGTWGSISGTLSDQTDLQSALDAKQASGNYLTALTSDVSASGPGSASSTVNAVGGSTASNVHAAELLANAATSANTASTIVKRGSSGEFTMGALTAASETVAAPSSATGTAAPTGNITVKGDGTNSGFVVVGDGANPIGSLVGYGAVTRYRGYRAAGSAASPTAMTGTSGIVQLEALAYNGSTFAAGASIQLRGTGTWSGSSQPSDFVLNVVKSGATTATAMAQIGGASTDILYLGDSSTGHDYLKLEATSSQITFGNSGAWIGNGGVTNVVELHGGGQATIWDSSGITFYGATRLNPMTTTTRDGLSALTGMIVYNSTLTAFQGYNGAWLSFSTLTGTETLTNKTLSGAIITNGLKNGNCHLDNTISDLGNITGSTTLDLSTASTFKASITGDVTLTLSNGTEGCSYSARVVQDGSHVITASGVTWLNSAGTAPTAGANGKILRIGLIGTGTTTADGTYAGNY